MSFLVSRAIRATGWPFAMALLLMGCATAFMGCASAPKPAEAPPPLFYPPEPAPPRVQYLTGITSGLDVSGEQDWFSAFILGKRPELSIIKPYGMAFWKDRLYVCDTTLPAIVVIDFEKQTLSYLASATQARLTKPINIAIDESGRKYVADTSRGLLVFSAEDRYIGEQPGAAGLKPTDVALRGDRLYLADLKNSRILVLDRATGTELLTIPRKDEKSPKAALFSPTNIALDRDGNLYVSDIGAFAVLKYDPEGRYLATFGSSGDAPGQFARPKGIAVDEAGQLYVVDAATQVVQVFDATGKVLMYFGEPREASMPLSLPATVRLDRSLVHYFTKYAAPGFTVDSLAFVSSQYGDHKVAVFGIGK